MRRCPACEGISSKFKYAERIDSSRLDKFAYASRKLPELMHRELHECKTCKSLFSPEIVTHESLGDLYSKADFDSTEMAISASETYVRELDKQNLIVGKSILDIGTGEGSFLLKCLEYGAKKITGVEPSPAAIGAADKTVKDRINLGSIETFDFGQEKFDLITFFMTIEHVGEPNDVVSIVKNLLSKDGHFAVICHNRLSLVNKVLRRKSPIFDIEHIQIFSKIGIEAFMQRNGFSNIKVISLKNSYPLHYWLRLAPLPLSIKNSKFVTTNKFFKIKLKLNVGNLLVVGQKIIP